MQKIETLFNRDERFNVTEEVRAGVEWVFAGEGIATEKLDGTNVRVEVKCGIVVGVEKRRNPSKAEAAEGIEPGYVDANRGDPSDKHIFRAVDNTNVTGWLDGEWSCEAIGPKIQGNPLGLINPVLYPFTFEPVVLTDVLRTFEGLRDYFPHDSLFSPGHPMEGIVFHHPDGRMAKIKARDFAR